ncbi:AHG_G0026590.mRNA.1.CDS.1 [Saccharomyces cerevisiae]|nr:AHG_G0026590.mRNA.1.CDS.1 [Saccharomyces cerevisiae]CAI6602659.1 AHG_G0026590.mRNA.1.CDS.1 [Saccharomyces cerevisiae]
MVQMRSKNMAYESGTNNYSDTIANGNTLPPRSKKGHSGRRKRSKTSPIACNNFCVTRQIDDDEQAFKMLDKVSHLKKFSAEDGDDSNIFVQWADDITDILSGLCCTGTFLKLLISSALSGRAKTWFDSTTEGIDDHVIKAYSFEKFLALLSEEFDGARSLRREIFTELLTLSIDSEKSLEAFAHKSGRLTPYYLSSGAALDLFLTKLEPQLQKQLENCAFPMTLNLALLITACEFAKGASNHKKYRYKNTRDSDICTPKGKNTAIVSKLSNTKTISKNKVIEKSDKKNYFDKNSQHIPDPKRRKQNEPGMRLFLVMDEEKNILPSRNVSANAYTSKNGHTNLSDLHTNLKNNKSQQCAVEPMSILNSGSSVTGTINIDLINDEVLGTKEETTTYDERMDVNSRSLNERCCTVKKNSLQPITSNIFQKNAEIQGTKIGSVLDSGISNSFSSTEYMFPPTSSATVSNPVKKNEISKSSQVKDIAQFNPFMTNEKEKKLNPSESFKSPGVSMEINRLSRIAGLRNIPGNIYEDSKMLNLKTRKCYPLHNFAVRTRSAHFNDRPSNYISPHETINATLRSRASFDSIQCITRSKRVDAETNKATVSAKSENIETKSRKFPEVINPFLVNTTNKKESD